MWIIFKCKKISFRVLLSICLGLFFANFSLALLIKVLIIKKRVMLDVWQGSEFTSGIAAWKVSVLGVFLVCIFPQSYWIQRDTKYLSVFTPNAGKCAPEKLRIRALFTQWSMFRLIPILSNVLLKSKKVFLQNWLTKTNIRWESHGNLWKHSTYVNSVPVTTTDFQLRASDFQASYWITFSFTKYVYIGLNLLKL